MMLNAPYQEWGGHVVGRRAFSLRRDPHMRRGGGSVYCPWFVGKRGYGQFFADSCSQRRAAVVWILSPRDICSGMFKTGRGRARPRLDSSR